MDGGAVAEFLEGCGRMGRVRLKVVADLCYYRSDESDVIGGSC